MKKYIFVLIICLSTLIANSQNVVKFQKLTHDFGTIKEENAEHSFIFKFKNISTKAINIQNVSASCGCTIPSWTQHEITPKDSGFVKAIFNATNRPGSFDKKLTVYLSSETGNDTVILTIKGNVKPKYKDPKIEFPDKIGGIRLQSKYIDLDRISTKEPIVKEYGIYNDTTIDLNLKVLNPSSKYMIVMVEPAVLKPNQIGTIKIMYDAKTKNDFGYVSDYFEIETNEISKNKKLVYVAGTIEEYFVPMTEAQLSLAPKIAIDKKELSFGEIREGEIAKGTIIITNSGKSELKIRKTVASCGCTASVPDKTTLAAGESTNLNVSFNSAGKVGGQTKVITIFSNDPTAPVQYLAVKAYVVK